jgi:hypothetical protein
MIDIEVMANISEEERAKILADYDLQISNLIDGGKQSTSGPLGDLIKRRDDFSSPPPTGGGGEPDKEPEQEPDVDEPDMDEPEI